METNTINHSVLTGNKVSELHDEAFSEFSNAPFEFEDTALALWDDTQKVYYHACTANRYSENYLTYCYQLEKNIKQLGSFCLTKAVLEQKGIELSKLKDMSIHELVCMVSFHFRKAHAALDGIYRENNILGMTYLNWEFRWVGLGNRLKATEVKIQKVKEGKVNVDTILEQTETFKGEPRTNTDLQKPKSLNINPSALPVMGSIAREMNRTEKAKRKEEDREFAEKGRKLRELMGVRRTSQPFGIAPAFEPAAPFEPLRDVFTEQPAGKRNTAIQQEKPGPGMITEGEARKILIDKSIKEGKYAEVLTIQTEDEPTFHARWDRHIKELRAETQKPETAARGPSLETRKALREKRKKKKK